jgi:hypothetical protein
VDQRLRNASHTARSVVNIGEVSEGAAKLQTELGAPQAVLDNPVFQRSRVFGYRILQPGDFAVRVTFRRASEIAWSGSPRRSCSDSRNPVPTS